MTSPWILRLTDDPLVVDTLIRLGRAAGVEIGREGETRAEPPGLIVVGTDRLGPAPRPAGVPLVLVATGESGGRLWRAALDLGVEQVLLLPAAEAALAARLSGLAGRLPARAAVVAVIGGCGGAGASVLAAALARTAATAHRTVLVEVDRLGGGADLLLGAEDEPGLRWPDLVSVRGRLLPGTVVDALPVVDRVRVLSWDRSRGLPELPAPACSAVLDAARQESDVVVVDLPRRLDPAALAAAGVADRGLLVVPAGVRAAAAARSVVDDLRDHLPALHLVVRVVVAGGLRPELIAGVLDLPLAGVLRAEPGLRAGLERGEPPGVRPRAPLASLSRQVLAEVMTAPAARRRAS